VAAEDPRPTSKPEKEAKVCVREMQMGSQVPRKVCRTVAEWNKRQQESQRNVEEWTQTPTHEAAPTPQ
jgi:hypothetical protein